MPITITVNSPDQTRLVGQELAVQLRPGDLVMLSGGLGAGKTTFTQGIGIGLQVKGRVSSPTFIVARVHPSLVGGADLIHADAYRIKDLSDLETLDLDSTLDEAITVVEWGEGKTEQLSADRLEIEIHREHGGVATNINGVVDLAEMDDGERTITIRPLGERWEGTEWGSVFSAFEEKEEK
ncbi:tRNA (adenosine(37)-N6)-threonylcarbamoyltransferase complex ATPase subunit type 1 TsaE [Varibaculum vaginae]|uniref:tRNA (adenosine(37)-N6)-threonylcarbamoyltransferase complex ATPase subunit type 1 TsaE n=1 Tax=Varibaculum vaginae TaxID=2364797 RepID=UPI000F08CE65|nr:tRNA (adenosine(37)-N6)-threonylcarbamoyltransferase complex ATPase subunit type 1 TsaE [Varibaculum vaginae]